VSTSKAREVKQGTGQLNLLPNFYQACNQKIRDAILLQDKLLAITECTREETKTINGLLQKYREQRGNRSLHGFGC
jgi:hypothetical protein